MPSLTSALAVPSADASASPFAMACDLVIAEVLSSPGVLIACAFAIEWATPNDGGPSSLSAMPLACECEMVIDMCGVEIDLLNDFADAVAVGVLLLDVS